MIFLHKLIKTRKPRPNTLEKVLFSCITSRLYKIKSFSGINHLHGGGGAVG